MLEHALHDSDVAFRPEGIQRRCLVYTLSFTDTGYVQGNVYSSLAAASPLPQAASASILHPLRATLTHPLDLCRIVCIAEEPKMHLIQSHHLTKLYLPIHTSTQHIAEISTGPPRHTSQSSCSCFTHPRTHLQPLLHPARSPQSSSTQAYCDNVI